jgi:hypothetical protein
METVKEIKITIEYVTDRIKGSNEFRTLHELKDWCEMHLDLAKAIGYNKTK